MYQIYINQTSLIITEAIENGFSSHQQVDSKEFQFDKFYEQFKDHPLPGTYLLLTKNDKELFKQIKQSLRYIKAAGGLVRDEKNNFLFIFRKGKWDLPKGKIEKGEKTKKAAVREVEEECGIKVTELESKLCKTYHIYTFNGEIILKKTTWFIMRADNQQNLIPQLEEGITDARWLSPDDFSMVKQNTYPLIENVIARIEI
ncbi:MAG: NUDIX domain-containing protein [Flavobacterium sp.]|nr:NUDIX domain-containing protein [Pedobacter sp.]